MSLILLHDYKNKRQIADIINGKFCNQGISNNDLYKFSMMQAVIPGHVPR